MSYSINDWMDPTRAVDQELAQSQWQSLKTRLEELGQQVMVVPGQAGWPDMVFAADCGLALGGTFWVSNFRHPERAGEADHYRRWFESNGLQVRQVPAGITFEGLGDVIVCERGLVVGLGPRSCPELAGWLQDQGLPVLARVELAQERFYHTANVLACLDGSTLIYYPDAFTAASRQALSLVFDQLVECTQSDAVDHFACNCMTVAQTVLMGECSPPLRAQLARLGWRVESLILSEFKKSGAGVRCLVLDFWQHDLPGG
ncbi:MAG: dimethylarginine dimethylaminohydrolase family protein [Vulcanimicrobiota bacterium]